ncbi:hypothetical protein Amn_24080 [Aminobacter sp. Y103A]|uniref:hypothetical protein n=1 Tax=Aminobacter sp. Y103A TaxID=1870862 RepID=UPI002572514A|nr:hypothetical protein [Aminobacter sp. SS-2016]BBD37528.1 hypothetical protein Amn_24080 [Aminobacter sp. SS-2016]
MKYVVTLAAFLAPSAAFADAVESAYRLCQVIDGAGLSTQPCEVSGWSGTVTAYLDMTGGEARKTCQGMAEMLSAKGMRFPKRQWTLQIKSPYSGGNSIAYCNLPQ